jgi:hypothetical protein
MSVTPRPSVEMFFNCVRAAGAMARVSKSPVRVSGILGPSYMWVIPRDHPISSLLLSETGADSDVRGKKRSK